MASKKKKKKREEAEAEVEDVQLHDDARFTTSRLRRILCLFHLSNHELERLDDVLVVPRRRLGPGTVPFRHQRLSLVRRDLPLDVQIRFVADYYDWDPIRALSYSQQRRTEGERKGVRVGAAPCIPGDSELCL